MLKILLSSLPEIDSITAVYPCSYNARGRACLLRDIWNAIALVREDTQHCAYSAFTRWNQALNVDCEQH
jgi:hypothetical protein